MIIEKFIIKSWRLIKKISAISHIKDVLLIEFLAEYTIKPFVNLLAEKKEMIFPPDERPASQLGFLLKWYESETVKASRVIIKQGMNVLDLGANFGYFSRLFSELVGPEGKIFAFEPHPKKYHFLVNNAKRAKYKNIIPIQKAILNQDGQQDFFEMTNSSSHSLYDVSKYDFRFRVKQKLIVETTTIDSFLWQQGNPLINFIKMDIEGAEPKALEGMRRLVAESKNLVILTEVNPAALLAGGVTPCQFLDQLIEIGFKVRAILDPETEKKVKTIKQLRNMQPEDGYVNLLLSL